LYEIKGDLSSLVKIGGGFIIAWDIITGVDFHPEEKDYLMGVSYGGKGVLFKVKPSDGSMVKENEIDLEMRDCRNLAFNGNGRLAVVAGYNSHFVVVEIGRNETSTDHLIFKRK
jgi:hypothetical protein